MDSRETSVAPNRRILLKWTGALAGASGMGEWEEGARASGNNPAEMPVLIEQYVDVGDQAAARQAAELWRFGPNAWKGLYNVPSPVDIQAEAESGTSIDEVMK